MMMMTNIIMLVRHEQSNCDKIYGWTIWNA